MTNTKSPNSYELMVLAGLQKKALYGGTVDAVTVADRRRKNRVARASRKTNRGK